MTPPSVSADDVDLSDLEFWKRPWAEREAGFDALRRERPIAFFAEPEIEGTSVVFPAGPGYHALTRHHDVVTASRHPEVFTSGRGAVSIMDLPSEMVEYFSGMISTDNPKHARLRRIVSNAFSPRAVRAVEDSVDRVAAELVDGVVDRGAGDFVIDVAAPLPLRIVCDMMGVPPSEYATVLRCSNIILSMGDSDLVGEGEDPVTVVLESGVTLTALMEELGRDRVANPVDDITSALVNAEVESERLTHQELASFFILLVVAGNETTRTALSHTLWALTEHPDQRELWLADVDGLAPTAVEELVRWASPVIWMRRTLASDYTLSGVDLKAGNKVLLFYNSANRDEAVFADPHTLDLGRSPNDHLGFGAPGPHFCLGAHLARREISVMWRQLLTRVPRVRATAEPSRLASSFINGIKSLPYDLG
ncbi:MAG TPA: cytochrome P450 [Acidimicrobiales bacterium]|nr:cytochrome P450 [Acidimicrobiales bacterium]